MRPEKLNPLFASIRSLSSVGPKRARLIAKALAGRGAEVGEPRVVDLFWHLPFNVINRRHRPRVAALSPGEYATLALTVGHHEPPRGAGRPYRVRCHDDTGEITLVFFRSEPRYLKRILPEGEKRHVSGRIDSFQGALQIVHPDYVLDEAGLEDLPLIEPVYHLTAGLSGKVLGAVIREAVARVRELPEWIDAEMRAARNWPSFTEAVRRIHMPEHPGDIAALGPPVERLAYDELLAGQLVLALVRAQLKRGRGRSITGDGAIRARIRAALPFSLTSSQEAALAEIFADMAAPERMLRLLQGDVGSGKTVVALLAMALAAEAGHQSALMAPTEILARQHYVTIAPLAEAAGLSAALLTGREKGRAREDVLKRLASGDLSILVGTHALFQEQVMFHDLAFAVVDEQHRFGVHQRLALAAKSADGVDLLVMTATPIPRTLVLTYFGDMDISRLVEKPAGRLPIDTRVAPLTRLDEVVAGLERAIDEGARVYWVCPLVEESEALDVTPAESRFAALKQVFGDRVGLVHGRMSGKDKDAAMAAFANGKTAILVATTVIEVGVDVPEATIMVVEHAERFGLAQLHQLRGRVGRGQWRSSCVLLYKAPLSEPARARLETLRESDDGFFIAEEDLRLRGEGEILGTRQSGAPGYRIARPELHGGLLLAARKDVQLILARDPQLLSNRGEALRTLLYLFSKDDAIRLVRAG
ncbi:MAG: ATP-dependent DNA helicase RecG [Hyphomicrobiales bacterium]|nr:ATP-dependent DNA helicase RecG [Hyphomicrobiales bacterium]